MWPPPVSWPANRTPTPVPVTPQPPPGDVYVYAPDAAPDYNAAGVKISRPKSVSVGDSDFCGCSFQAFV